MTRFTTSRFYPPSLFYLTLMVVLTAVEDLGIAFSLKVRSIYSLHAVLCLFLLKGFSIVLIIFNFTHYQR